MNDFYFFGFQTNIPDWADVATLRSTANLWGAFIEAKHPKLLIKFKKSDNGNINYFLRDKFVKIHKE